MIFIKTRVRFSIEVSNFFTQGPCLLVWSEYPAETRRLRHRRPHDDRGVPNHGRSFGSPGVEMGAHKLLVSHDAANFFKGLSHRRNNNSTYRFLRILLVPRSPRKH